MPCGTRLYFAMSSSGHGEPTSSTHLKPTPIGMCPMCSTPEPITASCTPAAISAAPKFTACCAEPHWRSTVVAGGLLGGPAPRPGVGAAVEKFSPPPRKQPRGGAPPPPPPGPPPPGTPPFHL